MSTTIETGTEIQISPAKLAEYSAYSNRLHLEVVQAARDSLEKASRIGEMLAEVRDALPHGEWLPWCEKSLSFCDRTARNYIRIREHAPKLESVSNLSEAYRVMVRPRPPRSLCQNSMKSAAGPITTAVREAMSTEDAFRVFEQSVVKFPVRDRQRLMHALRVSLDAEDAAGESVQRDHEKLRLYAQSIFARWMHGKTRSEQDSLAKCIGLWAKQAVQAGQ